jgi:hypothetical protein
MSEERRQDLISVEASTRYWEATERPDGRFDLRWHDQPFTLTGRLITDV